MESAKKFGEKDMQILVGNILRIGVLLAMIVVIAGLALFIYANGSNKAQYGTFVEGGHAGMAALWSGIKAGNANAIIELGVILLIATPIARILFALIGFWLEKDRLYMIISLIILCVMAVSIFTGAAH